MSNCVLSCDDDLRNLILICQHMSVKFSLVEISNTVNFSNSSHDNNNAHPSFLGGLGGISPSFSNIIDMDEPGNPNMLDNRTDMIKLIHHQFVIIDHTMFALFKSGSLCFWPLG